MTPTFQARLHAVQHLGNLNVSDLARWFDRPIPTVRSWTEGRVPSGAPLDRKHVEALLGLLEQLVKRRKGFPVDVGLSPADRIEHIRKIRKEVMP